jgi:hypothetical protein
VGGEVLALGGVDMGEDARKLPQQLRFKSTPANLAADSPRRSPWSPWESPPASPRSQIQGWKEAMGEGALLDGVRPAEIRSGFHFLLLLGAPGGDPSLPDTRELCRFHVYCTRQGRDPGYNPPHTFEST